MVKYSVIIPHKNCQELLCKCVSAIPDTPQIEVLVVDDNSENQQDLQMAINTLSRKNCTLILTTSGKGAGYARNEGLKVAKGKWLIFSDADDYYTEESFEIFDEYFNTKSDIVFFEHTGINLDTGEIIERSEYRIKLIEDYINNSNPSTEAFLRFNNAVPWAKMVRNDLVRKHNITFEEVPASNDTMFSTRIGYFASSIEADKRSVYVATARKGSITHTKSRERYFSDFGVYVRRNHFLDSIGHKECSTRLLSLVLNAFASFGIKEFIKYIKYAREYNVNVLYGESGYVLGLGRRLKKFFSKDELMVNK